jgi:hypothetical protein
MRLPAVALLALPALLASGCASVEYRDTNAAVDARPECAGSAETRPGEGVPGWCERSQEASWSNEAESAEIRFGGDN